MSIFYFPGWVRKSITFTIDDGNVPLDTKFMAITKPAGIKGTFNLDTPLKFLKTPEEFREFYAGYEIANHCRYHAYPFVQERTDLYKGFKNELFNRETADRDYIYATEEKGLYRIYTYDWTYLADDDKYMELVDDCQQELESVFGAGRIRTYIWPCGFQNNPEIFDRLKAHGFQSIRATGCVKDSTGFAFPADRMNWSYNADNMCLNEVAALYEAFPDDGELKFFCFGVHSHDFENAHNWYVLEEFCEKYGNRPQDFWYASVGDLYDYEDAVKAAEVTEAKIVNHSGIDLYAVLNGRKTVVPANSEVMI